MRGAALSAALTAAAVSCAAQKGPARGPEIEVPERNPTLGDRILPMAPSGAEAMLELDLARVRRNPVVGELASAVTRHDGGDLLSVADGLVLFSYGIGGTDPAQLIFAVGKRVHRIVGATRLGDDVVVMGPDELVRRAEAAHAGVGASLADDRDFLRARAMAMPDKAEGASLRAAAVLGFDARLAVAGRLDVDLVPAWLSVWSDVADDFAAVALIGGDSHASPDELALATGEVLERFAARPELRQFGISQLLMTTKLEKSGQHVRAVLVVGPRQLGFFVASMMKRIRTQPPGQEGT